MITLLDAAGSAAGTTQQGNPQSMWTTIIMFAAIFAIMYFLMIRPQRKRQKEAQNFINSLKKGDKVVTAGGIFGTVLEVKETSLLLEIDKDVKIRVAKNSVSKDYESAAGTDAPTK